MKLTEVEAAIAAGYTNEATADFSRYVHRGHVRAFGPSKGQPYFDSHVAPVAEACDPVVRPVAYLHDAFEMTTLRPSDWAELSGAPEWMVDALVLLTRPEGMAYGDYIDRMLSSDTMPYRVARHVKVADLLHNLGTLPAEHQTLRFRYVNALRKLLPATIYPKAPIP